MFDVKVVNSNDEVNLYKMINYDIKKDNNRVLLKLIGDKKIISYDIGKDQREKDIKKVYNFILNELKEAEDGNKVFYISEDITRKYIYVGEDITNRRQFTAIKSE